LYEPQLYGLSKVLMMPLPSWGVDPKPPIPQRPSVWQRITSATTQPHPQPGDRAKEHADHF
jgi:hypothetical protein